MSSDSMWSDYEADYLFASDRAMEFAERQTALMSCLSPEQQRTVRRHGLTLWAKHGKFRAYPKKDSGQQGFLHFDPALVPDELMEGGK